MKFFPYEKFQIHDFPILKPLPPPQINDQSLIIVNFEGLFLLSPSEITQELCKLITSTSKRIHGYKVPVVGKSGKLNDKIEVSAWWSIYIKLKNFLYPTIDMSQERII